MTLARPGAIRFYKLGSYVGWCDRQDRLETILALFGGGPSLSWDHLRGGRAYASPSTRAIQAREIETASPRARKARMVGSGTAIKTP